MCRTERNKAGGNWTAVIAQSKNILKNKSSRRKRNNKKFLTANACLWNLFKLIEVVTEIMTLGCTRMI